MGIKEVLLLALSAAMIIIGVHLSITQGVGVSYPMFMFAVALLFWFKLRRNKQEENNPDHKPEERLQRKKKR
ncbi:hypothetical protein KIH41_12245 [Litoribacter ruber]|uniref:Uncharacterized protein n=1 Tax=Litoribacter ruber TaxID=702568 RepID=A0AAP2G149_9BACT|nr:MULTISPECIES: hypothetical protein [Litoribacter]MBS9523537.1 hypothetical protein [Litoribacter alkaliphilus]MBT0812046.1 hypothetical protein [Litoribacter ruber]